MSVANETLTPVRMQVGYMSMMGIMPAAVVMGIEYEGDYIAYQSADRRLPKRSTDTLLHLPAPLIRAVASVYRVHAHSSDQRSNSKPSAMLPDSYDCSTLAHYSVGYMDDSFDKPTLPNWKFEAASTNPSSVVRICNAGDNPNKLNTGDGHWYVNAGTLGSVGLKANILDAETPELYCVDQQLGLHVMGSDGPIAFATPESIESLYEVMGFGDKSYSASFKQS